MSTNRRHAERPPWLAPSGACSCYAGYWRRKTVQRFVCLFDLRWFTHAHVWAVQNKNRIHLEFIYTLYIHLKRTTNKHKHWLCTSLWRHHCHTQRRGRWSGAFTDRPSCSCLSEQETLLRSWLLLWKSTTASARHITRRNRRLAYYSY